MINPFKIKINNRFSYNDRTIIIDRFNLLNVKWYYLDKWWKFQKRFPDLESSNILSFILFMNKYKYV